MTLEQFSVMETSGVLEDVNEMVGCGFSDDKYQETEDTIFIDKR